MESNTFKIIRLTIALVLVISVILFGYFARSPWVIVLLAVVFSLSFAMGKWREWQLTARNGQLKEAFYQQWITFLSQLVTVGIFYIIGRGLNAVFSNNKSTDFTHSDLTWIIALLLFSLLGGVFLIYMEYSTTKTSKGSIGMSNDYDSESYIQIDDTPITLETFFTSHHYSHYENDADSDTSTTLNPDKAFVDDKKLDALEAKLNIRLPKTLRSLYLIQNGGTVSGLATPAPEALKDASFAEEGWIFPFGGYDDLYTVEDVYTLFESIEHYADYPEDSEMFPKDSKRLIVIAQWYRYTLFLDYRNLEETSEQPRIGFTDFDGFENLQQPEWEEGTVWWDNFDTFFAQLRRMIDD